MPRSAKFDPVIFTHKTLFMQRIQEAVGKGYCYYTSGSISPSQAHRLFRKFADLYHVHFDVNARYRAKADGLANTRLFARINEDKSIDFVLLASPGTGAIHHLEKLRDVRRSPLIYREFELVRLTLKGRDKPSLTWRLTDETIAAWRQRLHLHTVHYNRLELMRDWYSLYSVPGFGGIRRQIGGLVNYWRQEWRRYRGGDPCPMAWPHNDIIYRWRPGIERRVDGTYWTKAGFPSPAQCPKLFYVRKQKDFGYRLSELAKGESHFGKQEVRPLCWRGRDSMGWWKPPEL